MIEFLPKCLRSRFQSLRGEHRQIARGMVVVSSFILLAKIIAMLKEMSVAWRYGISETVDAYLFVFAIVQWPLGILGGVIGAVLVPFATRMNYEAPDKIPQFRSELLGAMLIAAALLGGGALLLLPWLVQQPWIGLVPDQMVLARDMAVVLALVLPIGVVVQLWSSWTMVGNRQLNTLLEGMPAFGILVAVLLASGPAPLVWGTLVGSICQALLLYLPLAYRGEVERPSFKFSSKYWKLFLNGLGVMLVGLIFMSLVNLSDQFFAAHLGPGALSTFGYANRILTLLLGLGATAIGRASLPVLSRAHAQGSDSIIRIAFQWCAFLFGVGLLVAGAVMFMAPEIVKLLFERGEFGDNDVNQVAEVLRYALVQVPFYFSSMVLVYALLSRGSHGKMILIGGASAIAKLVFALTLVPVMGLDGLVLSNAAVYLISSILAMLSLKAESKK